MCGIAGIVGRGRQPNILPKVQSIQGHRGPDSSGMVSVRVKRRHVTLIHQRLSIIDLSDAGNQPMSSDDGRDWIIFNGEVYNYREIREELQQAGYSFRSQTDTEVILTALLHWGPDEAFNRFNGMWAVAWLDRSNRRLVLSRDRVGVKPLYYCLENESLLFGSEVKTILELSPRKFSLNDRIIGDYLVQSVMESSTETFFQGIAKFPAGHYGIVDLSGSALQVELRPYWRLSACPVSRMTEEVLAKRVKELFVDAVKLRLRSDVPVGVLLSGGVDSSAIASVMSELLGKDADINIFSAVSLDPRFDESPFIDMMGRYLNRHVTKIVLDFRPEEALDYLEQVIWFNDQPVGSFSNVAHYLLMKQAKEHNVTVILSGQGADELLCGYKKYLGFYLQHLLRGRRYGTCAKVFASFVIQGTILNQFNFGEAKRYVPARWKPKDIDTRGHRLRGYARPFLGLAKGMSVEERQALDVESLSVPVLTHYEDRMSMAWSREVRVPFLDYRLIELLVAQPVELKLKRGWTKYIFRKAMEDYLPRPIAWRKDKQGFVNPESEWLKVQLRERILPFFAEDSLMSRLGYVDTAALRRKYEQYCDQPAGRGVVAFEDIFNPLALEIWLRKFAKYIDLEKEGIA